MKSIDFFKRELISTYVYFLLFALSVYALGFYFFLENKTYTYFLLFYICGIFYTWSLIKKHSPIKIIVHLHLTTGLLISFFVMLNFWKYSVATSIWLLPIPLAAYIFFEKKFCYIYSIGVVFTVLAVNLLHKKLNFNYFNFVDKRNLIISDSFIVVSNMIIFLILLHYYEKIKKKAGNMRLKKNCDSITISSYENKERYIPNFADPVSGILKDEEIRNLSPKEIEKYKILFQRIKEVVEKEKFYMDVNFSISQLSSLLKTNNLYISIAIKQNGYSSFNHFINTYRVNCVKKLIRENDLSKVTLMSIYSGCGFANQSTFNRAFRRVEGITPSEFIKNTNKT